LKASEDREEALALLDLLGILVRVVQKANVDREVAMVLGMDNSEADTELDNSVADTELDNSVADTE
jgi:hypothetical protein